MKGANMNYKELIERLNTDAEWAEGYEWDAPICLRDDLLAAIAAVEKLKAYEDTGLEPEDIKKHEAAYNECLTRTYGPFKQKISKWLQAEKDGRLVVLPCKVGAPVYTTHWWKDVKEKCTDSKGNSFYRTVHKNIIKKERFNPFGPDYEWLGQTVFLTREEAEAALKGGTEG